MQLSELEWAPGWELYKEDSNHYSHAHGCDRGVMIIDRQGEFVVACIANRIVTISAMQVVLLAAMPPGEVYAWAQERAGG